MINTVRTPIADQGLTQLEVIGEGPFTCVRRGDWNGISVAIKTFDKIDGNMPTEIFSEFDMYNKTEHPNLLAFFGVCTTPSKFCLVLEKAVTNLTNHLPKIKTDIEKKCIALNVARGLAHLHANQIAHTRLKPDNILLTANGQVKISDFGISKIQEKLDHVSEFEIPLLHPKVDTKRYCAPENFNRSVTYIANFEDQANADIYSYGMVVWGIITKRMPFTHSSEADVVEQFAAGRREVMDWNWSAFDRNLISNCWSFEPSSRPKAAEIVKSLESKVNEIYLLNFQSAKLYLLMSHTHGNVFASPEMKEMKPIIFKGLLPS